MLIQLKKFLCVLLSATTLAWSAPTLALARELTGPQAAALEANPVEAVAVRLGSDQYLHGIAKTADGKPAAGSPVVLGVNGKPVGRVMADEEGKFSFGPLKPGKYQVATRDAAAMLAVYSVADAPTEASDEIEVSQPAMVARGQSVGPMLTNPWFLGLVIAAAIAIPLAIVLSDDDDDDAS